MKVLFTADLHIKLGQKNVPIDWQRNRYLELVQQLNKIIAEQFIDILVIGGDIFDRLPTIEELELYFEMIAALNPRIDIIIYPGNHEAVKKHTTFLSRLVAITSTINSRVIILDDYYNIDNMDFIPYNRLKDKWPEFSGNICFTHCRGEIPPHVKPEIDLDIFDRWDLVLAGDLHSHSNCQRNIIYPGSPLTTSFHRNEVETGVIVLDSRTLQWTFEELNLPQLLRKTVSNPEEMIPTDFHHTIYEIEGDVGNLANIKNSELLDKKIVKREHKSRLSLNNLSIEEELRLYLDEVLEVSDVDRILKEANDYIKDANME
jgi:DNA repair exonuclease SbcCD nuclease subunit